MEKKLYDLTAPQRSIWLTEQFGNSTSLNNVGGYVLIHDKIKFDYLEKALIHYISKNSALNLHITLQDGFPKQYFANIENFNIDFIELKDKKEVQSLTQKIIDTPFNLLDSTLYKLTIFKLPNGTGGFIPVLHHIIADAWSMSLLIDDIIDMYSSFLKNEDVDYSLAPSYIDYIDYEKKYLEGSRFQKDSEFWNKLFDCSPDVLSISRQTNNTINTLANRKIYTLDSKYYMKLNNFCKQYNCSVYTFFMAIYMIYLAKINHVDYSIIGTPVLNRANFKEKNTSGMFVNTVPFKASVDYNSSFSNFLQSISSLQLSIFRHQKYPYEFLLNDLKEKYNSSHNLYDMAISYQNAKNNCNESDVNYESMWLFNGHCIDTLQIHFYDMDNTGTINMFYDYQVAKLSEEDVENIHRRIMEMCDCVLNNFDIKIKDIEIIDNFEKDKLLNKFNESTINHPKNIGVYGLIENVGNKNANHLAVVDDDNSITYKELLDESDKIARNLVFHGIKKSDCVAVLFSKKNINLICTLLGILKAGACFLAIYPDYPNDRIQYMLQNSGAKLLLTDTSFSHVPFDLPMLNVNDLECIDKNIVFPKPMNDDPAYVIYTSGSTGKPKGTIQTHNNLINFVYSFQDFFDNTISTSDKMLSVTNICFDVSIAEIFTPLVLSATLYLYKDLNYSNPYELAKYIMKNNINFSYFPPSMLPSVYEELNKYKDIPLNKLLVGVEPIRASTLLDFLKLNPDMKIINGYGPSETTVCCTMYKFNKNIAPDSITPIGIPIGNSKIFIYDSNRQLVPIGDIGEIYVQGECVGNGYINNPEITNERFDLKNKIYRTGDLAKWLPDGNILFVGRNDNQVKYRGYRIDLGEIEHSIKNIESVENCTVLLNKVTAENSILTAFIVLKESNTTEENIREILSSSLPHYMIPNQFVFLDSFPITPNGKIDKKQLLSMVSFKFETPYVAPTTVLEQKLADLWAKVLNKDKVGINDNFFEIGGDSLSAIKIATLALQENIVLSAQNFYTYPTINLISKHYKTPTLTIKNDNYINSIDIIRDNRLVMQNDIFLIGATGFLGSHILFELIHKTNSKIYCLIRGDSVSHSKSRLQERLHYYFGNDLDDYFDSRIIIINGDFSKKHLGIDSPKYEFLLQHIKTVINSAAVVKHVGDYDYFYKMNILSVENLISFCKECKDAHLAHISTLSVSGNHCNAEESLFFTEKDLYIKQDIDENIYVKTKFEAEQLLAKAISNGLDATIFRLGNITWRNSDAIFQINENENLFFNFLNFILLTKKLPTSAKYKVFNMSPVDDCACLIVNILLHANNYKIYHVFNTNTLTLNTIVDFLNRLDYNIEFTDEEHYLEHYLVQHPQIAQHFNALDNTDNVIIDSPYTMKTLDNLNFNWTTIDLTYINKKIGGKK